MLFPLALDWMETAKVVIFTLDTCGAKKFVSFLASLGSWKGNRAMGTMEESQRAILFSSTLVCMLKYDVSIR